MVSSQRDYQIRKQAEGNCIICGKPRGESESPRFCGEHLEYVRCLGRARDRRRYGCKPWVKGGRGRPPKQVG